MSHPNSHPDSHRIWATLKSVKPELARYGLALALVVVAIALRAWLDPVLGHPSVATFMAAILLGAWFGGVGPAIVCLVVLHIAHGYWFQNPKGLFEPNVASYVTIAGWYAVGITVGVLSQMRTAAQSRARAQQIEADSQREQLRSTLSCMADGVVVTDVHGRLTLMNRAAEDLTGWRITDSKGEPLAKVFSIRREGSQELAKDPIDRVLHRGRVVHEQSPLVLISRTGREIPIAYSAAPIQSIEGQITGVVLVFRDETERRRAELALQEADRRKDEFLATLAHELRNPLAPIAGGLELLELSPNDSRAADEVRSMMKRQTQHMVRLIDDLLDVSRITRGKLELRKTTVALSSIVRDAVAATRPLIDEARHQLSVRLPDQPLLVDADANRLTQVLTNLLNNAAKYTPRGGRVELAAQRVAGAVVLTVTDSGMGIPPDKLESVFDMFTQLHDSRMFGHTGLGIGLTLVKRLVEMHGGSVEAQSRGPNQGTTFTIRLPALAQAATEHKGAPQTLLGEKRPLKRRVLVVDDNLDALDTLSRLVEALGNEVLQARDGLEAMEIGQSFQPDIVLMDLGMPKLNGYDAARRLRQEPWGRELTLVATTGWGHDDDRRRTAEAGFDHHLVKPVALAALREVLDTPQPQPADSCVAHRALAQS
jgi:PAS domain S-box-containing protein